MDKKKKSDVADAEDLLRRTLTVLFWLWHGGKVGQSSLEAAERITAHQGYHEAEVSCGGEADLHRHYTRCKKNPGHTNFIPIHDFKIEHLPSGYRDDLILDWIKSRADLTCRLSVRYTSEKRPQVFPGRQPLSFYPFYQDRGGDYLRVGTGWMVAVEKYTEKDQTKCECDECTRPGSHTPKKVWGKVLIGTACHVVFDSDEARHTTCEFFYDTSKTPISQCPTLKGLKVESNIYDDWCQMTCVSHDMDMIDKLYKIQYNRFVQVNKLMYKYQPNKNNSPSVPGVSCLTDPTPQPTVIISHPHGCSKMVTVGKWTYRETLTEIHRYKDDDSGWEADRVATRYTYNTPTCRGSSGAPVIRLPVKGKWWCGHDCHIHSEGGQGNVNKCGAQYETASPINILQYI